MNLETKITIYKFTPQLFTLTPETCGQRLSDGCGTAKDNEEEVSD